MSAPRKQPPSQTHLPLLLLPNRRQSRNRFRWSKAELDEEDGISYYELEFTFSQSEYECEVDAVSGSILKFEQD